MRLFAAGVAGLAIAAVSAIVLGDYPLSGSVPWLAAILIPFLIGAPMVIISSNNEVTLWIMTGPIAAVAMMWGIRIATGWGQDPIPAAAWIALVLALVWPPAWGAIVSYRSSGSNGSAAPAGGPALPGPDASDGPPFDTDTGTDGTDTDGTDTPTATDPGEGDHDLAGEDRPHQLGPVEEATVVFPRRWAGAAPTGAPGLEPARPLQRRPIDPFRRRPLNER